MAHGGIRYLENGEFRLVREAVEERNRLLQNAPHYVSPLPTVIPIFKWFSGIFNAPMKFLGFLDKPTERGAAIIKMGLMMYDAYTGKQATVPKHEFYLRQEALKHYPEINPDIVYTAKYYDGLIHAPERLCVELVLDAEEASAQAKALNYMSVLNGEGNTVYLKDEISGETLAVQPQIVINAAGPWVDFANQALGHKTHFIGGTKGSHLVLDHPELRQAIGEHEFFFENDDGRIVLICPLLDKVLVGTSDIAIEEPDEARCTDEEIDYFLSMIPKVFPNIPIDRSQIVFTFSGVRPLPASDANTTGQISRDHTIKLIEPAEGLLSAERSNLTFPTYNLIGGKWTTFRAFAEQVTDQVLARLGRARQSSTENLAIGGGKAYPPDEEIREQWLHLQQKWSARPRRLIESLFKRYGTRAEFVLDYMVKENGASDDAALTHKADYYRQEIAFLAQNEKIVHLDDLILRRSLLAMLGHVTEPLLNELADIVADALDWSPEERQKEVQRTIGILGERHRVELGEKVV
jgi:glycerol-3-phosphate dehydrogenase